MFLSICLYVLSAWCSFWFQDQPVACRSIKQRAECLSLIAWNWSASIFISISQSAVKQSGSDWEKQLLSHRVESDWVLEVWLSPGLQPSFSLQISSEMFQKELHWLGFHGCSDVKLRFVLLWSSFTGLFWLFQCQWNSDVFKLYIML